MSRSAISAKHGAAPMENIAESALMPVAWSGLVAAVKQYQANHAKPAQ